MTRCVARSDLETVNLSALDERLARYRLQNRQAEQLMAVSLQRYGQLSPIVVCAEPEDRWLLIDGLKRLRASRQLKGQEQLLAREQVLGSLAIPGQGPARASHGARTRRIRRARPRTGPARALPRGPKWRRAVGRFTSTTAGPAGSTAVDY
jgi:hypothetical protein